MLYKQIITLHTKPVWELINHDLVQSDLGIIKLPCDYTHCILGFKKHKKDHVIAHTASWDLKKTFKKDHVIAHIWPMAVQKRVSHV